MMGRLIWLASFLLSTFALSKVFEASRHLTGGDGAGYGLDLVLWLVVLVFAFMVLGYGGYRKARTEGKPVRRIWLYDLYEQWTHREMPHS